MKKHEKLLLAMLLALLAGNALLDRDDIDSCRTSPGDGKETILSLSVLQYELLRISTCETQTVHPEELRQ